ncbi:ATP-binding cassette domain-containing protein, partial [Nocardia gipuzkoensis]
MSDNHIAERGNELAARGLALHYGEHTVINGLDLVLPGGAVTAIVGPNACGKSTLLRGLTRLLRPSGGAVTLDGADIHRMPALMRKSAAARGTLTAGLLIAALAVTAGTGHAAPDPSAAPVNYQAKVTEKATIISTDSGALVVEDGTFKIKATDGTVLAGTELAFRV